MIAIKTPEGARIGSLFLFLATFGLAPGEEPIPEVVREGVRIPPPCEDRIDEKVAVDPKLNSPFFESSESFYPWHIIEHPDGHLEDTMDGTIDQEDLLKIERSAKCTSSHQGNHAMSICDGEIDGETVRLRLSGGLPAYWSSLNIEIDGNKKFRCSFEAIYPNGTQTLKWRITSKSLRVRTDNFREGHRIFGWISVEFDEVWMERGKEISRPYKIEGYLKPILIRPKKQEAMVDPSPPANP